MKKTDTAFNSIGLAVDKVDSLIGGAGSPYATSTHTTTGGVDIVLNARYLEYFFEK